MDEKGQLMDVPIKLVLSLVVGMLCMGVLVQFVGTAERSVVKDMSVQCSASSGKLTVKVHDGATGDPLYGATIQVSYPGGSQAKTLSSTANQYTFTVPGGVITTVRVTHQGYIPWEGQVAVS
ncbi:MAG: hypothetical protein ACK4GQ_00100 [Candidatus Hadarchaeales archaeon]